MQLEKRRDSRAEGINGITFHKNKLYGASWGLSDIYELDPNAVKPPRAFGLTEYFKTPDGIEVLDDGTFLVSDSEGNQVVSIAPDEKQSPGSSNVRRQPILESIGRAVCSSSLDSLKAK